MQNFTNKVIVITGANSGIGEAAAVQFVDAGGTVFGIVRSAANLELARAKHPNIRWMQADISDPAQTHPVIEAIAREAGRIDVLVNNAAIGVFTSLADTTHGDAAAQFATNVLGAVGITHAALPALRAAKGTIVNISSAVGTKPAPNGSIYAATKAAINSLTRSWALELAPDGIRVNAIAPGPTETPVFDKLPVPKDMVPAIKASFVAGTPLGRMASAAEVARWIVEVAAPATTWMTGTILAIDGGMAL